MNEENGILHTNHPEWPHLSLLYEILMNVISSPMIDMAIRKHYTTVPFVLFLISLFDTMDSDERIMLKTTIHRIYSKLTNRRATIRRAINHTFYEFLYESHRHYGISELLEILASIINGFTVPIRSEHLQTLQKSLSPLHKMSSYEDYAIQLSMCMSLFVQKDPALSEMVFLFLYNHF